MKELDKLIDDFMKSKGEYISYRDQWGGEYWGEYKPTPYQSDWNHLMTVVNKINEVKDLNDEFKRFEVIIEPNCTHVATYYDYDGIHKGYISEGKVSHWISTEGKGMITNTYETVISFINEYNSFTIQHNRQNNIDLGQSTII